jgi:hypothetical protein
VVANVLASALTVRGLEVPGAKVSLHPWQIEYLLHLSPEDAFDEVMEMPLFALDIKKQ